MIFFKRFRDARPGGRIREAPVRGLSCVMLFKTCVSVTPCSLRSRDASTG